MHKVKIEKAVNYSPMPGRGSHEFYGYAYVDGRRVGIVWKPTSREGNYLMVEDIGHHHNRAKRPKQFSGKRLSELKLAMSQFDWNDWFKAYTER